MVEQCLNLTRKGSGLSRLWHEIIHLWYRISSIQINSSLSWIPCREIRVCSLRINRKILRKPIYLKYDMPTDYLCVFGNKIKIKPHHFRLTQHIFDLQTCGLYIIRKIIKFKCRNWVFFELKRETDEFNRGILGKTIFMHEQSREGFRQ
jgi:hypothetical protein